MKKINEIFGILCVIFTIVMFANNIYESQKKDNEKTEVILKGGPKEIALNYGHFIKEGTGVKGGQKYVALLIEALEKHGSPQMAEGFLNSGEEKLIAAGNDWANKKGYRIFTRRKGMIPPNEYPKSYFGQ